MFTICFMGEENVQILPHHSSGMIHQGGDAWGNGSIAWQKDGLFLYEIAQQLHVAQPLAAKVDGVMVPLQQFITADAQIDFITADCLEGKLILQRTAMFLLAFGVTSLQRACQRMQGGIVDEQTVYYDFLTSTDDVLTASDCQSVQREIHRALQSGNKIVPRMVPYHTALKNWTQHGEYQLIEKIKMYEDSGEPVPMQILESFFELNSGILLKELSLVKEFAVTQIEQMRTVSRVYGKISI